VTIKVHVTRMEILNKYIGMLPTIKNSSLAVPSMERGNTPFTKPTHVSIILSQLPVAWRNQYDLTHQTVPESPRAMLQDLETIEKVIAERYNDKARTDKVKAATAPTANEPCVPKKRRGEGSEGGTVRRDGLISIASGARLLTDHSRPPILTSAAGSQKTVGPRTSLPSLSGPERKPGRKLVTETPIR